MTQKFLYNVPSDRELAVPGSHWNETEFKGLEYSDGVLPVFVGRAAWSAALPVPRFQGLATLIPERRPCPLLSPVVWPALFPLKWLANSVLLRRDAGCLACDAYWCARFWLLSWEGMQLLWFLDCWIRPTIL